MDRREPQLLTDEQMRKFITDGVLLLKTDFPQAFHHKLVEQLNHVYDTEGNPGNNLLPRVKELQRVFDHPVITGALTSVLGPEYMLHAHRHGHYNAVSKPGGWHKDSYWGYDRMRNHHSWWAMIMYFPQDTPVELGPTGIMPGTQNYATRTFRNDETEMEVLANGEAGTFALIHYDIWHRSTANMLGTPRFMLKFEFMRTTVPTSPSWDNQESEWRLPQPLNPAIERHDLLWQESWNWLSGQIGSLANTLDDDPAQIAALAEQLADNHEPTALNAAYELACRGAGGRNALAAALRHDNLAVSRLAGYGLSISGEEAVGTLIDALRDDRVETLYPALFALGEMRDRASRAVPELLRLLQHPSEKVRFAVIEALGMIGAPVADVVGGLIRGLQDTDTQVRFTAGLSLVRIGRGAEAAVSALANALDDENRYVRAHALEALRAIGTEEATKVLLDDLFNNRWCYSTTPASTFYP